MRVAGSFAIPAIKNDSGAILSAGLSAGLELRIERWMKLFNHDVQL
jgi:hypothetical protein